MEEILVDGHYMLLAVPQFSKLVSSDQPEEARDELIRKLEGYRKVSGRAVSVVFDASLAASYEKTGKISKVKVFFTKEKQNAASAIKALVKQRMRKDSIRVVTADQRLGKAVQKLGAKHLNDLDFLENGPQTKATSRLDSPKTYGKVPIFKALDSKSLSALRKYKTTLKQRTKSS